MRNASWHISSILFKPHTGAKSYFLSVNSLEFDFSNYVNFVKEGNFKNEILVKNEILKMWFLWKMGLCYVIFVKKSDFENAIFIKRCDFKIVNFAKYAILKMWIYWIMWFWTCEFLDKMWIFAPLCAAHTMYTHWKEHDKSLLW